MSTQTQTPAQMAEDFLKKYATVIGTLDAIERKDREFLLKYFTVVGAPEAINTLTGFIDFTQTNIVFNDNLIADTQINITDGVHTVNLNGKTITPKPRYSNF